MNPRDLVSDLADLLHRIAGHQACMVCGHDLGSATAHAPWCEVGEILDRAQRYLDSTASDSKVRLHPTHRCVSCGRTVLEHPRDEAVSFDGKSFLYVLCDGSRVKC